MISVKFSPISFFILLEKKFHYISKFVYTSFPKPYRFRTVSYSTISILNNITLNSTLLRPIWSSIVDRYGQVRIWSSTESISSTKSVQFEFGDEFGQDMYICTRYVHILNLNKFVKKTVKF